MVNVFDYIFILMLVIIIIGFLIFIVVGLVMCIVGDGLVDGLSWLYSIIGVFGLGVFGFFYLLIVIIGLY